MKLAFIPLGSFIWPNFRISPVTLEWRWNCVSCHRRSVCFVKSRRTPATRGPMTADCPNIHHLSDPLTPTPIFQPLLQTPNFLALHPLFSQFDRSQYTKLTSVPLPLSYKASLIWIYRLTFHLNMKWDTNMYGYIHGSWPGNDYRKEVRRVGSDCFWQRRERQGLHGGWLRHFLRSPYRTKMTAADRCN